MASAEITAAENAKSPAIENTEIATVQNADEFRGGRAAGPNDIFIAVMGVTGSGKSTFISACTDKIVTVGHGLTACTSEVDSYAYEISPDRTVYLIDTPGFDDTNRSDADVLRSVATWLAESYRKKILLHGIIYLHRITDPRMQGSARKNLLLFRELCGEKQFEKVHLVTTMWENVSDADGSRREKELLETEEFWGWMKEKGSSCQRHANTPESARGIVLDLAQHVEPVVMAIQTELVDKRLELSETKAGKELETELQMERKKWEKERQEIEQRMTEAIEKRDKELQEMLAAESESNEKKARKNEQEIASLRETWQGLMEDKERRLQWALSDANKREEKVKALTSMLALFEFPPIQSSESLAQRLIQSAAVIGDYCFLVGPDSRIQSNISKLEKHKAARLTCRRGTDQRVNLAFAPLISSEKQTWRYVSLSSGGSVISPVKIFFEEIFGTSDKVKKTVSGGEHSTIALGPQMTYLLIPGLEREQGFIMEASPEAGDIFTMHSKNHKLGDLNIAFGIYGSFVIYSQAQSESDDRSIWPKLQNSYPYLDTFLQENTNIRILSLALDQESTTEFILIYETRESTSKRNICCRIAPGSRHRGQVDKWWRQLSPIEKTMTIQGGPDNS